MRNDIDKMKGKGFITDMDISSMDGIRGGNGSYRTNSLFIETINRAQVHENSKPLYCLRPYSVQGLPSLYHIFMEAKTEYDFAMQVFGSMGQWRKLSTTDWFLEGLPTKGFTGLRLWREDKKAKEEAALLEYAMAAASEGNVPAMKMLYDRLNVKGLTGRKPTKAEIMRTDSQNEKLKRNLKDMLGAASASSERKAA